MHKDKDIIIRIDELSKNKLKDLAKQVGLSLSSFIRFTLYEKLK